MVALRRQVQAALGERRERIQIGSRACVRVCVCVWSRRQAARATWKVQPHASSGGRRYTRARGPRAASPGDSTARERQGTWQLTVDPAPRARGLRTCARAGPSWFVHMPMPRPDPAARAGGRRVGPRDSFLINIIYRRDRRFLRPLGRDPSTPPATGSTDEAIHGHVPYPHMTRQSLRMSLRGRRERARAELVRARIVRLLLYPK